MLRFLAVMAVGALLYFPAESRAQIGGGVLGGGVGGIGLQGLSGMGLGAPPAGVGLHQQYMQLYGLPVNFTSQSQINNGGASGIFPGYGGFGGGLGGRFYGVNYQRQLMAAQYMQYAAMARYQQQMMMAYGLNTYPNQPANSTSVPTGSFGMSQGVTQHPYFNSTPTAANNQFRGFGFASSYNSPLPKSTSDEVKKDDKKEQDKDQDK